MKRVNFHLTEHQIVRLRAEADRAGVSVATMIRRAVDALLARAEKAKRGKA